MFNEDISGGGRKAVPHFVVIGSMRAGTTMVHDMLARIDGLCMARMKETDFFIAEKNYDRGLDWYMRQFSDLDALCGEASPNYTKCDVFSGVAERLHKVNPEARLIYIVRDPIERAISQYNHSYMMGQDLPSPEVLLSSQVGEHILAASSYARQLEPWISVFGRDALLIVDFDALCKDPDRVVDEMCSFIGLDKVVRDEGDVNLNSAGQLGAMPRWLVYLRGTRFGDTLRAILPRNFVKRGKAFFSSTKEQKKPPVFPDVVKDEMRARLADDMAQFRGVSGMSFAGWSV